MKGGVSAALAPSPILTRPVMMTAMRAMTLA